MGIIYKATNKINNKVYIGQTTQLLKDRIHGHKNEAFNNILKNCPFHRAIVKYGLESFEIEKIEEVNNELLNEREIYWIDYYDSYYNGYNATLGGQQGRLYSIKDVLPYWELGYGRLEISKITGMGLSTITSLLLENGISLEEMKERRYQKVKASLKKYPDEIYLKYWNQGKTIKEIADILEISYQYISMGLKKVGITADEIKFRSAKKRGEKLGKRCALVDEKNNILAVFNNRREAAKEVLNNVNQASTISKVCDGRANHIKNFIFRDVDDNNMVIIPEMKVRKLKTAICGIKKDDPTDIVYYDSISEAARKENLERASISKCIAGSTRYSTVGGRIWKRR